MTTFWGELLTTAIGTAAGAVVGAVIGWRALVRSDIRHEAGRVADDERRRVERLETNLAEVMHVIADWQNELGKPRQMTDMLKLGARVGPSPRMVSLFEVCRMIANEPEARVVAEAERAALLVANPSEPHDRMTALTRIVQGLRMWRSGELDDGEAFDEFRAVGGIYGPDTLHPEDPPKKS